MLLEVDGLHAGYGDLDVVLDVNLKIDRGEVVTLLGANGAGKSTTLKAIAGVIRPSKGSVHFNDEEISGRRVAEIVRRGLAFCPEGRELYPDMTVLETLTVGGVMHRLSRRELADRIDSVCELFPKLAARRKQRAGTMSGGEQQMLAIGRSLMLRPELLLLDEPSLGLAPLLVDEVMSTVRTIAEGSQTTVLLVEQNASLALDICDRAYVMEAGAIVMQGKASDLAASPDLRRRYLGEDELEISSGPS